MAHKLSYAIPIFFVAQIAFSQPDPCRLNADACRIKKIDQEPNWEKAEYVCPVSIKTEKNEYQLRSYFLYKVSGENGEKWSTIYQNSDEQRYVSFRFQKPRNIYLSCLYNGFDKEIILYAEGAVACGDGGTPWRVACWITNPYVIE